MIDEYKIKDRILLESVQSKMDKIYASAFRRQKLSLGYPLNQKFDYTAIAPFLNLYLNNVGDPYASSSTLLNTHELEQETLDYFAKLWHATPRTPLIPDSFWGYVLAMGATEGNMYALWSAREYFQVRHGESSRHPILYFSQETHYSIEKCAKIVGIETFQKMGNQYYPGQCPITEDGHWPNGVPVDKHGAIDPESLSTLVNFFTANGYPSIIVLNLGTTFRGAFDDPQIVWQNLSQLFDRDSYHRQTNRLSNKDLWIHIDGALGAAYLPYLEIAFEKGMINEKGPCFDFRLPWINSVVMSSHKWFGAPFASGIYMSKEKYRMPPAALPEYINSPDTTLGGSRNGISALMLWYATSSITCSEHAATAACCMQLAVYAYEQLATVKSSHPAFRVEKGPLSLVVVFTRPNDDIFSTFQLSGKGEFVHIVVMPHVTRSAIDRLVKSLHAIDAFDDKNPAEGCPDKA